MTTVFDSPELRTRLQAAGISGFNRDEISPCPRGRYASCDFYSYSYFALSIVLVSVGTVVTLFALGDADGRLLTHLGHMWLVGPIFVCAGMMVAFKSMYYLKRKNIIQMILYERAVSRRMAATAHTEPAYLNNQIPRTPSTTTLPPSYDTLITNGNVIIPQQSCSTELPPPTYDEAMLLIENEKTDDMKICDDVSKDCSISID